MIALIPATLVSLLAVVGFGSLALHGLISPYVAASVVTLLCYKAGLPSIGLIAVVFSTYLSCLLLQTAGSTDMTSNSQLAVLTPINPYERSMATKATILKIVGIASLWLIPIPKPLILSGPLVFVIAAGLTVVATRFQGGSIQKAVILVLVQSSALLAINAILPETVTNSSLGLISCLAIPPLLLDERQIYPEPGSNPPTILPILISLILCLCIPGYSLAAIAGAMFPVSYQRSNCHALLEGCTEGWVLNQLIRSSISAKTPLGDLLGAKPILAGTSEFPGWLTIYLLLLFAAILLVSLLVFCFFLKNPLPLRYIPYKKILLFSLVTQAVICLGLYSVPFLIAGTVIYALNRASMPAGNSITALSTLVPVSFS